MLNLRINLIWNGSLSVNVLLLFGVFLVRGEWVLTSALLTLLMKQWGSTSITFTLSDSGSIIAFALTRSVVKWEPRELLSSGNRNLATCVKLLWLAYLIFNLTSVYYCLFNSSARHWCICSSKSSVCRWRFDTRRPVDFRTHTLGWCNRSCDAH